MKFDIVFYLKLFSIRELTVIVIMHIFTYIHMIRTNEIDKFKRTVMKNEGREKYTVKPLLNLLDDRLIIF